MYRAMRQWQEWLTTGEKTEDDLIEAAFEAADKQIAKRNAKPGEDPQTYTAEDEEWRLEQEARYRKEFDWNEANDESALQMLLDLEQQLRALNREFSKASLNVGDRVELLKELRNIAKDHSALQKTYGIDRVSRENRSRTEDPMAALRSQITAGADYVRRLRGEWEAVAPTITSIEELVARAQHHSGLSQPWLLATLAAHRRLLGVDSTDVVVE